MEAVSPPNHPWAPGGDRLGRNGSHRGSHVEALPSPGPGPLPPHPLAQGRSHRPSPSAQRTPTPAGSPHPRHPLLSSQRPQHGPDVPDEPRILHADQARLAGQLQHGRAPRAPLPRRRHRCAPLPPGTAPLPPHEGSAAPRFRLGRAGREGRARPEGGLCEACPAGAPQPGL